MPHETALIATIAVSLTLAFVGAMPPCACPCRRSWATCWRASPWGRSRRDSSPTRSSPPLFEQPLKVLAVLAIIVVGKSLAALAIVLALRYPLGTALSVSAALAQIGEFSFILAGLGMSLGLLPPQGNSLILAGAILSIALNPLRFAVVGRLRSAETA